MYLKHKSPILCVSCRYMARWWFGVGAGLAGVIVTLVKLFT